MRIAIVGAGPAGCHLAHRLGGTDHEILLLDPRAPYEKPCGGGLSPLVGQLFPEVMALPFDQHRPPRVLLRASDGGEAEYALEGSTWAVVSRAQFGQALLDRALGGRNVRLIREKVTGVDRGGQGWRLHTAEGEIHTAEFLVGADGVRSVVRKAMVGPIPRQHLALAVGYLVRGAPDALIFQTYSDLHGYAWSFPRHDQASAGIATWLAEARASDLWQRLDRFLDEACPGALRGRRWAGLLPMARDASLWDSPCAGDGWALLGDAAGHVHPITGEGITYAVWSAELLGQALGQGDSQVYGTLWRQRYGELFVALAKVIGSGSARTGRFEILFQVMIAGAVCATT